MILLLAAMTSATLVGHEKHRNHNAAGIANARAQNDAKARSKARESTIEGVPMISLLLGGTMGLSGAFLLYAFAAIFCCNAAWFSCLCVGKLLRFAFAIVKWPIKNLLLCGLCRSKAKIDDGLSTAVDLKIASSKIDNKCQADAYGLPACSNSRQTEKTADNRSFLGALCALHADAKHGELFQLSQQLLSSKYVANYRWFVEARDAENDVATRRLVQSEIAQAKRRTPEQRKQGFIYLFTSQTDKNDEKSTLAKIGETTLPSAAERVAQWNENNDVAFDNRENVGWWRTSDTASAEQLIHAALSRVRIVRHNGQTQHDEIEWFCAAPAKLRATVADIVAKVNVQQFDKIGPAAVQN